MPVRVHVPGTFRAITGGTVALVTLPMPDATLADLFDAMEHGHPGTWHSLVDDRGRLKPKATILVDGVDASENGLLTPVGPDADVWILPASGSGA